jgi:molybdate transport system substrate-binding protein
MKTHNIPFSKIITALIFIVLLCSCGKNNQKEATSELKTTPAKAPILVFAGAGITDVLAEIIDSFEVKYKVKVQTNLGSSGTLARQIEQGATPDIFISASKRWANYVDSLGYIIPGYKSVVSKNELVLIAPLNSPLKIQAIDSTLDFVSLLGKDRLSMGDPEHVPAGKYASESLKYYGWYSKLKGKMLLAKDVRSALMYVEMEEAPIGIVYLTDAERSKKVKILGLFPKASHKPIVYVAGLCKDNPSAKDFFNYLNSEETKAIWLKHGFKK